MLFKQFPNQNSCTIVLLTLLKLGACTIASKHFVLQLCTDCAVKPTWVILPSLVQGAVELLAERENSDNTLLMLCTGADVDEIVLEVYARMFPAWEVTVNEADYG